MPLETVSGPLGPFGVMQSHRLVPGALRGLMGPLEGHLGPKRALLGSLGAQKRPDTRPKCVATMTPTQLDQSAAIGTKSGPKSGPLGPSDDLRGLQKGSFWPRKALLGAPEVLGGPRGFRFGPNCRRLVHLGWTHGYHTLWPGIRPLPGPRGLQKGPFWLPRKGRTSTLSVW